MKLTYRQCPTCGTTYPLPDSARRCYWCQNGYAAGVRDAVEAVKAYADDTHQHVGIDKCWPESGDRCDITAALQVAAQQIQQLGGER